MTERVEVRFVTEKKWQVVVVSAADPEWVVSEWGCAYTAQRCAGHWSAKYNNCPVVLRVPEGE